VITGMGAVTPLGCGVDALFDRWVAGDVAIEDGAGRCADFDPVAAVGRKESRRTDRYTQLTIAAADEAISQAGWDHGIPYDPEMVGCVIGSAVGGQETVEHAIDILRTRGAEAVSPMTVPMLMANAAPGQIALRHGFHGSAFTTVSACASGGHALGVAMRMIQSGECHAVVAGGADAPLTDVAIAAFANMEATSPTGESRPFDRRRNGFVMAEGAGVLVLEDAERASARGATVLGELAGYASTDDAFHITAPRPDGGPAARAMERALADAQLGPLDVSYVNAHGTGTALNDLTETLAIKRALGDHAHEIPVSSLKSSVGHMIGGAGACEAIVTVCALRARVAPPTLGYAEPDPELDLDYVPGSARSLEVSGPAGAVGLSNSFGFGGHNVVLCVREAVASA
jgi:3-oxoacyl-[acyl-carrier-protein] synthase II